MSYIPEILEEHYEEIQFLWSIQRTALRSPRYTLRELGMLDERIEAHIQGMLVVGERMRELTEPGLVEPDINVAFAAAFSLLRLNRPATTQLVIDAFVSATGPAFDGIHEALCHAASAGALAALETLSRHREPAIAAASLETLAWRAATPPTVERIKPLLAATVPNARRAAWRTLALLGAAAEARDYSAAMRDDDPGVRSDAAWSAVWTRVPGILTVARHAAENPNPETPALYQILAAVGTRDDIARIVRLAESEAVGPASVRIALIGDLGHPSLIDSLLARMSDADPEVAAAAGHAFVAMTAADTWSKKTAKLKPAEPTGDAAFDEEFAEEVQLPSVEKARAAWEEMRGRLAQAERIRRGEDISRGASMEQFAVLDAESRWLVAARNRYYGIAGPSPADLARFPQSPRSS
jgi:uncharacterized protein (TIGR02270 family)